MSRRVAPSGSPPHVEQLQKELGQLKEAAIAANVADNAAAAGAETAAPSFDSLSGTEKSAASLGIHPEAWRPIGFMNNAHYEQLMKSNALDGDLARRIDAYRVVAAAP
tara:strand:- start:28 stop:351 length:324 start_codon:yes stop_codon:yes gene_type:complete